MDLNATQAAIRAGYAMAPDATNGRYYVYLLVDPRDGFIFYVGKGKSDRMRVHYSRWANNTEQNARKALHFSSIGGDCAYMIFGEYDQEALAYSIERQLIDLIVHTGISNSQAGVASDEEKAAINASAMLDRVKPFEVWVHERIRTTKDVALYFFVTSNLEQIKRNWYGT